MQFHGCRTRLRKSFPGSRRPSKRHWRLCIRPNLPERWQGRRQSCRTMGSQWATCAAHTGSSGPGTVGAAGAARYALPAANGEALWQLRRPLPELQPCLPILAESADIADGTVRDHSAGMPVAIRPAVLRISPEPPEGGQVHEFLDFKAANHAPQALVRLQPVGSDAATHDAKPRVAVSWKRFDQALPFQLVV